ncbi:hypothetical protein U1Q18_009605, partial [Sarracenia purpurea var. burkii]
MLVIVTFLCMCKEIRGRGREVPEVSDPIVDECEKMRERPSILLPQRTRIGGAAGRNVRPRLNDAGDYRVTHHTAQVATSDAAHQRTGRTAQRATQRAIAPATEPELEEP